MADKLTDSQVADLLAILRSDSPLDAKVQFVTNVKSGIKQHNVPESCVAQLFDGLRTASSSQHAVLVNAGFTALNHLLTRLSRQDPKLLAREAPRTLPLLIERLGDQKDKYRSLAIGSLNTLSGVAPADVERFVRNSALAGKHPRAKEGGMHWLLQVNSHRPSLDMVLFLALFLVSNSTRRTYCGIMLIVSTLDGRCTKNRDCPSEAMFLY